MLHGRELSAAYETTVKDEEIPYFQKKTFVWLLKISEIKMRLPTMKIHGL